MAARLERAAECRVTLMDTAGETVAEVWDAGLDADGILLFLSPASVPQERGRGPWESLLSHVERSAQPPVCLVETAACRFPEILKRRNHQVWSAETPRAMERWVLSLHPPLRQAPFVPAAAPGCAPPQEELDRLWAALVDACATVHLDAPDASRLAQSFAHAARGHFREIVWIGCHARTAPFVMGELHWRLETSDLARTLGAHRILVVLDGWTGDPPALVPDGGRSSVLITAPPDSPPHLDASGLSADAARLWTSATACRPGRFPLHLALEMSGAPSAAVQELEQSGHITTLDEDRRWYRRVAAPPPPPEMLRRHDELLRDVFAGPVRDAARCRDFLPETEATTDLLLARRVFRFLRDELRYEEAALFCSRILDEAWEQGDQQAADDFEEELRWMHEGAHVRRPWKAEEQLTLF